MKTLILILLLSAALFAQTPSNCHSSAEVCMEGEIIHYLSGKAQEGITVDLEDLYGNLIMTTTTNADGKFWLANTADTGFVIRPSERYSYTFPYYTDGNGFEAGYYCCLVFYKTSN